MTFAWNCSVCTFRHKMHANRCQMCGNLRGASAQEMRDFITGGSQQQTQPTQSQPNPNIENNNHHQQQQQHFEDLTTAKAITPDASTAGSGTAPSAAMTPNQSQTNVATQQRPVTSLQHQGPSNFAVRRPQSSETSSRNPPLSSSLTRNPYAKSSNPYANHAVSRNQRLDTTPNGTRQPFWKSSSIQPATKQPAPTNAPLHQPKQQPNQFLNQKSPHVQQFWKPQTGTAPTSKPAAGGELTAADWDSIAQEFGQLKPPPPSATYRRKQSRKSLTPKTPSRKVVQTLAYIPGPVPIDAEAAKEWVYPLHEKYPVRQYQLEMAETAIHYNTLVSLPTGLGKTLIAAVVLNNFYRWFPTGKVVFMAPTLPLVDQQLQACYNIVGIPAYHTAVLNGRVKKDDRGRLWESRRVFFCTPQTVERDIEEGQLDAERVVCVVLDEAHRASGNYAYTKVVGKCEAAGAKFRVLGLSATPGSKLEAIQKVIDAIRISRVEVRLEDDPAVKEYTNNRQTEVVLVKQSTAVASIERMFSDLMNPMLRKLVQETEAGVVIKGRDRTLTPWCIVRAREYHHKHSGDRRYESLFFHLQSLLQARTDLVRQGVHLCKQKLISLKNKGGGAMVKTQAFRDLFDAVVKASSSSNPMHSQETPQDKKLNNPKLMKLEEILVEHFKRAEACGTSSRSIVFTQWRESVSEIVHVLAASQPLLRPRQFVGQGKQAGSEKKRDPTCASVRGMRQKEQQQVIKEFQDGKHNILICTSIGEEGLDIGEVDLIVNFDTLKSPIRMVQRVGRTGRKRDGRVVSLVSEGQEQQDMLKANNASRTIGKALKRMNNFRLKPDEPLFPSSPSLNKKKVEFTAERFHMSQVGGHRDTRTKQNFPGAERGGGRNTTRPAGWQLSEDDEARRLKAFGRVAVHYFASHRSFPSVLRRKFVRARGRARSSFAAKALTLGLRSISSTGITRRILLELEGMDTKRASTTVATPARTLKRASRNEKDGFPLENVDDGSASNEIVHADWDTLPLHMVYANGKIGASTPEPTTEEKVLVRNSANPNQTDTHISTAPARQSYKAHTNVNDGTTGGETGTCEESNNASVDVHLKSPACLKGSADDQLQHPMAGSLNEVVKQILPSPNAVPAKQKLKNIPKAVGLAAEKGHQPPDTPTKTEFRLPTPPASSSESDGGEDDSDAENDDEERQQTKNRIPETISFPSEEVIDVNDGHADPAVDESRPMILKLPTQESSEDSDSESSDFESGEDGQRELQAGPADQLKDQGKSQTKRVPELSVAVAHSSIDIIGNEGKPGSDIVARQDAAAPARDKDLGVGDEPEKEQPRLLAGTETITTRSEVAAAGQDSNKDALSTKECEDSQNSLPPLKHRKSRNNIIMTQEADETEGTQGVPQDCDLEDTPVKTVNTKKVEAQLCIIEDTPDKCSTPSRSRNEVCLLVDTPSPKCKGPRTPTSGQLLSEQDVGSIVCGVCHSGDSPEEDPIILCDGENDGKRCPVSVHMSCYSVAPVSINQETWRCDVCEARHNGSATRSLCFLCQRSSLPLLKHNDNFVHPSCMSWSDADHVAICRVCGLPGAPTCKGLSSCRFSVHPHCAAQSKASSCLFIVDTKNENSSLYCHEHRSEKYTSIRRVDGDSSGLPLCIVLPSPRFEAVALNHFKRASDLVGARVGQKPAKRPRKISTLNSPGRKPTRSLVSSPGSACNSRIGRKRKRLEQRQLRQRGLSYSNFIETEAGIASDDDNFEDDDDESAELQRIEDEEELQSSFINDSSQLGYSPDVLDRVDADAAGENSVSLHRELDAADSKRQEFLTPVFNRQMRRKGDDSEHEAKQNDEWDNTPLSAPSSEKGLGNMHFIRSVIEHHRKGGDADEIEKLYNKLEQEGTPIDDSGSSTQATQTTQPTNQENLPAAALGLGRKNSPAKGPPPTLTESQRARIEAKRKEALARRQRVFAPNRKLNF